MGSDTENAGCLHVKLIEYHDFRTLMGPCFISFSLPLFVPGVVLTVVGSYGNDHSFARFGAWHITGIVILAIAVIMFVCGVVLKCCFRPVLTADIEQHLTPNSSMISGKHNLGYDKGSKIYTNNSHIGHAKVGHRDNINDVAVSTHEPGGARTTKVANGKVKQDRPSHERQVDHFAQNDDKYSNRTRPKISDSGSVTHLPDIETVNGPVKKQRRKRTDSSDREGPRTDGMGDNTGSYHKAEVESGGVKTTVTAKVVVQAETSSGYRSRDPSSDANENAQFLPPLSDEPPKRRKKKKKHRKASSSSDHLDSSSDVTRPELPELRIKPALGHNHPHNPDQHVHFEGVPDTKDGNSHDENRAGDQVPDTSDI